LGQAHLVLGNYEPDAKKKKQHLDAARDLASRAAPLVSEYNHSARLLLGNIYEDLASQVREDPKQNYLKAMDRFREVQEKNSLSAQARTSRARCVLKALVTSGLNAQDIGLAGDRDAALKKCIDDLEEAVRYAVQDADRTEAHSQLGQVYEVYDQQGHWAKADENHGKAAELAKQSGASTRAAYVSLWAMLPLNHATRLRPGDSEISKLLDDAERRAKELQGMPPGAYVVPAKQAAIILGSVWQMRGNYEKAVTAYSEGLPPDLAQADSLDVRLLLARAPCNLARPEVKAGKGTAFLQAVLQDASRAAALAPDRADSHYCAAIAYDWLWDADKAAIQQLAQAQPPRDEELKRAQEAAIQHRDEAFNSVHKAVELVPKGDNYVIYRSYGATLIVRVVGPAVAQIPRKDAIAHFEEAERWLQEAIDASQDPEQKKDLSTRIEQVRKPLAQLRGAPPPVPAPNPAN
jgi:tetratricopeptide (TPR) repeat protein